MGLVGGGVSVIAGRGMARDIGLLGVRGDTSCALNARVLSEEFSGYAKGWFVSDVCCAIVLDLLRSGGL